MVNNIVISFYGDRWLLNLCGDHFTMYTNAKSLCSTLEPDLELCVNYISIRNQGLSERLQLSTLKRLRKRRENGIPSKQKKINNKGYSGKQWNRK